MEDMEDDDYINEAVQNSLYEEEFQALEAEEKKYRNTNFGISIEDDHTASPYPDRELEPILKELSPSDIVF
jgi:hypothetical protein